MVFFILSSSIVTFAESQVDVGSFVHVNEKVELYSEGEAHSEYVGKSEFSDGMALDVAAQREILQELYDSLFDPDAISQNRMASSNHINFLASTNDGRIHVSLFDNTDAALKKEILSLPGIDSDIVEFIEFEITWIGPKMATEAEIAQMEALGDGEMVIPFSGHNIRMGSTIFSQGGWWTMGPPANTAGTAFYTATHGRLRPNDNVTMGGVSLARVWSTAFGGRADVARVNFNAGNHIVHSLSNIRGSRPPLLTTVTAHTAFSGNVSGRVIYNDISLSGNGVHLQDAIAVHMRTQTGDSGAALVNSANAAVGVLSFGAEIFVDGRWQQLTVFTNMHNIHI